MYQGNRGGYWIAFDVDWWGLSLECIGMPRVIKTVFGIPFGTSGCEDVGLGNAFLKRLSSRPV